jgi:hypothetical protein
MAVERVVICGGVPSACEGNDPAVLRLRLDGPGANVHREGDDLEAGMYDRFPPAFADLLDIAAYVYAADQAVSRRQGGGDFERNWRRCLTFHIPVREPDRWRSTQVMRALVSVLSFLSDDEYHFEFVPGQFPAAQPSLLEGFGTLFTGHVDEVVMFSGGLDSLGGAVREVIRDRRRVLLVNHRSNPKPGPRLRDLKEALTLRSGDVRPHWKRVRLNKSKDLSVEPTQRARSFLYAALGATYAHMIGLDRVRFYENGVVSLNLPIGRQVVGAKATRTTHPRVLAGFTDLFTRLAGRPLAVDNPFLGLTKTDVVRSVLDAGCGELVRFSVSCAETRGRTNRHPHCGDCSQCIDRRFAVLAAGAERYDPAEGYEIDLVTGSREGGPSRTLLASYLDVATRVGRMTADQFAARFGEVGRVLRFMPGTPGEALAAVFGLYQRHAGQVNGVVDRELTRAAETGQFRDGSLPPGCLVRLMSDTQVTADPTPTPPEPENVFRRKAQAYLVRYRGGEENILLPSKGAAYVHALLSQPEVPTKATSLASTVARRREEYALGSGGKRADQEALAAYRAQLIEIAAELEEAKESNDPARQERLEGERATLLGELKKSTGIGGKLRDVGGEREKVRKAVTNAIARVIDEITLFDAPLGQHLAAHIDRGHTLIYKAAGTDWLT